MANTLTGLIPQINEAMEIISREMVGMIPAVTINTSLERAAKDQTIRIPISGTETAADITPAQYAPNTGDNTTTYVDASISKSRMVPIRYTGEEDKGLANGGIKQSWFTTRVANAMRTLVNEIEVDLCTAAYKGGSRAVGTAGTTPFTSSIADAALVRQVLDDNGAPMANRAIVLNSTAGVKLRSLTGLNTTYAAGTDATLRQGTLLDLMGLSIKESAGIQYHTKGAGTGYGIVAAGEAVGQTTLSLDGGTVNTTGIKSGDVVTFAGGSTDTNKYVVNTGLVATSGDIVIGNPGLRVVKVDADAMTIGDSYYANIGFSKNAIVLIARPPALPTDANGRPIDMADDIYMISDPISGLTFEVAVYSQYKQVHYEVGLAWGYKVVQSEHICVLMG